MNDHFLKLMLVTHKLDNTWEDYLDFITIAAGSGITAVQLREKHLRMPDLIKWGKQLQAILKPRSIPLIVNDHIELCLELNAEGLHLGQGDGDPCEARKALGQDKMIGLSIDTMAQAHIANQLPIDYIGVGAIFPTRHKQNVETIWGLQSLKQVTRISKHPVIAIGGIDKTNANLVMKAGAKGIAAIGAFHDAQDVEISTQDLRKIVEGVHYA